MPASCCPTPTRGGSPRGCSGAPSSTAARPAPALKRLYVHDSIYDEVCGGWPTTRASRRSATEWTKRAMLGPVQNAMQFNKVRELVEDARAKGGRVLIGGKPPEGPGYFYPITLVADVDHGVPAGRRGAVRPGPADHPLQRRRRGDRRANDNSSGLGGSVCGPRSGERARRGAASSNAVRCGSTSTARSSPTRRSAASSSRASASSSASRASRNSPRSRRSSAEVDERSTGASMIRLHHRRRRFVGMRAGNRLTEDRGTSRVADRKRPTRHDPWIHIPATFFKVLGKGGTRCPMRPNRRRA